MNPLAHLTPNRRAFLTGTLLLTGTGFACRVLGFFYRIFLSRTIGAEGLGVYNMVHPVFGICFALCAGSIQTALSQYIASHMEKGRAIFRAGLIISMIMSVCLAALICSNAEFLAAYVLMEPRCAPYLPIMGISVPFAALHACINGYYYGMQKSKVPAFSQIAEQIVRMVLVFFLANTWAAQGRAITVHLAVYGHLIGEIASAAFTMLSLWLVPPASGSGSDSDSDSDSDSSSGSFAALQKEQNAPSTPVRIARADRTTHIARTDQAAHTPRTNRMPHTPRADQAAHTPRTNRMPRTPRADQAAQTAAPLLALALPLMGNRLVLNVLAGAEAVWIPSRLQMSGLNSSDAFAVYGVLTGMALPFILFPSAITNSMAVLLLPSVAQAQAEGRKGSIAASISMSLRYSLYMGILCIGIFTLFGEALGTSVFHDPDAGHFIQVLAWLCPFLYLATTLGSILNGLGRTRTTFLQNTAALLLRIGFVLVGIPRFGIMAYLCGMLASELLLAFLHLWSLTHLASFTWNAWEMIVKPAVLLMLSIGIFYFTDGLYPFSGALPLFVETSIQIMFLCFCYGGFLLLFHFSRRSRSHPPA